MPYCLPIRHRPLEHFGVGRSVWRYIPLWKFEDLIRGQHLFFTRLPTLVDQYEGTLAPINYEDPEVNIRYMLNEVLAPGQDESLVDAVRRQFGDVNRVRDQADWARENTYVNCWFMDEFESQRMWDVYVPDGCGVAVQSTLWQLRGSFDSSAGNVCMQPVIYYDPASGRMVPPDPFHMPLYKHDRWRHEQEFRCFEIAPQIHETYIRHKDGMGVWVPCSLQVLVSRVRLAPNAPSGLLDHVRGELRGAGLDSIPAEPSRVHVQHRG